MSIPVVLIGASGLLAGELARLLEGHPTFSLAAAVSRTDATAMHSHLSAALPQMTEQAAVDLILQRAANGPVAVVQGLPHGASAARWRALREALGDTAGKLHVVDLSADYRLADRARFEEVYGAPHADPDELDDFVYGLPERTRAGIAGARRVASPGCFATAMQLAVLPAAAAGALDERRPWMLSGVTGSSGAGNTPRPSTHHPHRHGNLWAYSTSGHRHEAELEQALSALELAPPLHFVPHSGPYARGIHLTAFLPLSCDLTSDAARELFEDAYREEPFVDVVASPPDLRAVVGSNRVLVSASVRGDVLTVLLTLDNVIKGGAGQALQCLNLMLGLPEVAGLPRSGMGVC